MLDINIPGAQPLRLSHLILDYNGTLACDGSILPGVTEGLGILAKDLEIHILTADTFGSVRTQVAHLPVQLAIIPPEKQAQAKAAYIENLGPANSVAIGNGKNDALMLQQAALGIAVVQTEGAARLSPGHGRDSADNWMIQAMSPKFYASNPAGGACSNELLGARLPQAPPASTIPERRAISKTA